MLRSALHSEIVSGLKNNNLARRKPMSLQILGDKQ